MKVFWPILLQAAAFCLAMAELLLPSFGVLTILCLAVAGYSWYLIGTTLSGAAMVAFFIADLALIPAGFYLGIRLIGRSPLSHRSDLGQGTGLESDENRLQKLIGQNAVVEAMLRPAGKVRIGEDIYEAITTGDYIPKDQTVRVVALNTGALQVELAPSELSSIAEKIKPN
jgi:membrane-bound serine protease (ClpP class)